MAEMMIFSGNANKPLAESIAKHLDIPLGNANIGTFSDGETSVKILENVRGRDVFILQPTCAPANENLMELMLIADAIRRASAERITAVIPYFGYARQDRRVRSERVPISAKIAADMLADVVEIDRVLTVDLHADQVQGFFHIPVDNTFGSKVLLEDVLKCDYQDIVLVSPDVGGVVRARQYAKRLEADLAIIDKRRPKPNAAEVMNIIGEVEGKDCVVVDDIVDTAGTLCTAAKALKEKGARRVVAYATHPVLSGSAIKNISGSELDELVVTDTIPLSPEAEECPKIRQLTISVMLSEAMRRVNQEESLSCMFD